MKVIRLLFKDTKEIVTLSFEEIARECRHNPTELEIMKALKEMEQDNKIVIITTRKEY